MRLLREELFGAMQELGQVRQEAQSQWEQAEVSPGHPAWRLHRPAGSSRPSDAPVPSWSQGHRPPILAPWVSVSSRECPVSCWEGTLPGWEGKAQ